MPYCRECGAKIIYDRNARAYVCPGCGLIYTPQDLIAGTRREIEMNLEAEEKKRRKYAEYLEWWTSSKK